MIKVGQKKNAKYWGRFAVKKVAMTPKPVICNCDELGEVEFMPTIVEIDWEKPPSADGHRFWFPYWVRIQGREKYGQFAPMIGEIALFQLLEDAIRQGFFSQVFLADLASAIEEKQKAYESQTLS